MRIKKTVEKVMIPNPPIWKRTMVITWPGIERSFPRSIVLNPVTQTAEVEAKRASTKGRLALEAAKGNQRKIPPVMITAAKLTTNSRSGVAIFEYTFLNEISFNFFLCPRALTAKSSHKIGVFLYRKREKFARYRRRFGV